VFFAGPGQCTSDGRIDTVLALENIGVDKLEALGLCELSLGNLGEVTVKLNSYCPAR